MTLGQFAVLVGAEPKWILNARAVLGRDLRYSVSTAERLSLAQLLSSDFQIPLPRAWAIAGEALDHDVDAYRVTTDDGLLSLEIDLARLRSAIAIRRSQLATTHQPRRAGRKPARRRDAIEAARRYGLDVTLLQANIERRPEERLRQLDDMAAFLSRVKRKG